MQPSLVHQWLLGQKEPCIGKVMYGLRGVTSSELLTNPIGGTNVEAVTGRFSPTLGIVLVAIVLAISLGVIK